MPVLFPLLISSAASSEATSASAASAAEAASAAAAAEVAAVVEELDVAVLHVLLILLQCAPSIAIRCEADVSLSTGSAARGSVTICASVIFVSPPVIVVVDHHVHRVGH